MSQPLVSVIIPLYNRKHLISRCVKSVCDQTYPHLEIIVVDDGSTDEPDEVLAELAKDSRVRIIRKPNGGVSSARNLGLDTATGKYIQFVDSDDVLLTSAVQRCVDVAEKEQATEVVYGFAQQPTDTEQSTDYSLLAGEECVAVLMSRGLLCGPVNKLFRKDLIGNLRFSENISWGEDFIFNLKYTSSCNKVTLLHASLYYVYDSDSGSLSRRYDPRGFDDAKAQIAAVNTYLSTPRKQTTVNIMKGYLWMCYLECARKVCNRSRLPFGEKIRFLRLWAQDKDIIELNSYAHTYPWECFCLAKNWSFLFPFAYALRLKLSALKNFISR